MSAGPQALVPEGETKMFGKLFKRNQRDRDAAPARNPLASRLDLGDDSPTDPVADEPDNPGAPRSGSPTAHATIGADAATRIVAPPTGADDAGAADPPVGVLLIVAGPGTGSVLTFGHGMNAIGRGAGQRVRLDFGDDRVSRERHALITYDGQGRRFYLQHGGGPGLTYLRGEPLLEPAVLEDGDRIVLGDTELLFRPLVGDDFDWSGAPARAPAP